MVEILGAEIAVLPGSGNVLADMGMPEPAEELARVQLAGDIRQVIKRRRLTRVGAAAVMDIDEHEVSALIDGRLTSYSSERLMRLLTALSLTK